MPSLWLPAGAGEEMLDAQRAHAARTIVGAFEHDLKAIDPRLGVCFVDAEDPNRALRLGFWHVYRRNEDGTLTWWEVSDPEGKFMEPNDKVLDKFREMDTAMRRELQKPDYFRRKQEERQRKIERQRASEREDAIARVQELADFQFRVQVPLARDGRGRLRDRKRDKKAV